MIKTTKRRVENQITLLVMENTSSPYFREEKKARERNIRGRVLDVTNVACDESQQIPEVLIEFMVHQQSYLS